jgi:hypothetical protein
MFKSKSTPVTRDNPQPHGHSTRTTFRISAGMFPYSCSFFCQRRTHDDVIDPRDTAPTTKSEASNSRGNDRCSVS